jgi:hypothetical protein
MNFLRSLGGPESAEGEVRVDPSKLVRTPHQVGWFVLAPQFDGRRQPCGNTVTGEVVLLPACPAGEEWIPPIDVNDDNGHAYVASQTASVYIMDHFERHVFSHADTKEDWIAEKKDSGVFEPLMTKSDMNTEHKMVQVTLTMGTPAAAREFVIFVFEPGAGMSSLWWSLKSVYEACSLSIGDGQPSRWWNGRWEAWLKGLARIFPNRLRALRKAQRWTEDGASSAAAVGPFPEEDEARVLEGVTASTLGLCGLAPRWVVAKPNAVAGGMKDAQDRSGVRSLVEALAAKASTSLPEDGGAWDITLVFSPEVEDSWHPPLRPEGPQAQTLRLRVSNGMVHLAAMRELQERGDLEGATEEQREAGALLEDLQERLGADKFVFDQPICLAAFVLKMAEGGFQDGLHEHPLKKVYLFGQVVLGVSERLEMVMKTLQEFQEGNPFPDNEPGTRKRNCKYLVASHNLMVLSV